MDHAEVEALSHDEILLLSSSRGSPLHQRALLTLRTRSLWLAVAIIVAAGLYIWSAGRENNFLLCDMECGETLLAVRAADQFAQSGVQYGLLENLGSVTDPSLYTHSVNIGSLTFVGLEAIGIHSFSSKILLPLAAYSLGLLYVFFAVRKAAGSPSAALIALFLFAITYWGMGAFALNALRAWHLLAFFMIMFHCGSLARFGPKKRDFAGLLIGAILAFGCGYDYWVICACVAICVAAVNFPRLWSRESLIVLTGVAGSFGIPFVLRQVQIIYAMGLEYWLTDIKYSIAIKIPYATWVIAIPSLTKIDSWYRSQHVIRPPASPSNSALQMFETFAAMVQQITIPRWGWLAVLLLMATALVGGLGLIYSKDRRAGPSLVLCTRVIFPVIVGLAIGVAALAPFTLHVYFKHEFPLIGFPILLAKAAALSALVTLIGSRSPKVKAAAFLAAFAILADHALVAYNNTRYGLYPNFGWASFMRTHPEAKYDLCAFTGLDPNSVPALKKILGIDAISSSVRQPPCERTAIQRLRNGKVDYVIYQPATMVVDFDAVVPTCRARDWLSRLLEWGGSPPSRGHKSCIYGTPLPPRVTRQSFVNEVVSSNTDLRVAKIASEGVGYVVLETKAMGQQ